MKPKKSVSYDHSNTSPLSLDSHLSRRAALKTFGAAGLGLATGGLSTSNAADLYKIKRDRIHQSVVPWCFRPMSSQELIRHSHSMGLKSVELIDPQHWALLKKHAMTCAIAGSHGFAKGFAHTEEHAECHETLRKRIDLCADAGVTRVITFSGFRRGISTEDGSRNMVKGLKAIASQAEKKKVTVCMEMLNSRVDVSMKGHPDYFCDDMDLSIDIIKKVGSERVKVLFDIYHVQIMHGDIITRIQNYHPYIGHYHTAGVPGRNEIDDTQEINYVPILKAILKTGYQGFVGQEFIPLRDKVTSLNQAVRLCDI
jgi:hydroxypyruvate isomerase